VANHLATCGVCLETMRGLPDSDDSLIDNLRRYVRDGSSLATVTAPAPAADSLPTRLETTAVHGGPTSDERSELNRPRTFGNYELLSVLGEGGMGTVYKARQKRLDWLVALKVIKAGIASSPEARARFALEGKAVARLRHPHVVRIHDSSEVEGQPYYAMELLEGGSLKDQLGGKQQPERAAAQRIRTLALGVHAAHCENIIHRDLKPGNVLLDKDGNAKVSDFGLAKLMDADQSQTLTDAVLGTPPYMAPEQARGNASAIGFHTDVYALGAILYEMLTGRPPFLGANRMETLDKVKSEPPRAPARLRPGVNPDLEAVCLTCLEKEPTRRYPSAQALADDLSNYLEEKPTWARPLSRYARAWRTIKRHAGLSIAAAVLLLVGLATAGVAFYKDPERRLGSIESEIDAGGTVVLIGGSGGPRGFRWQSGEAYAEIGWDADHCFTLGTRLGSDPKGIALLELAKSARRDNYRFRAEVRHNASAGGGQVGVYFAHQRLPKPGELQIFLQLALNDIDDVMDAYNSMSSVLRKKGLVPPPPPKGNAVKLIGRLYEEGGGCDQDLVGIAKEMFKPAGLGEKPWHSLTVEVTPAQIRVLFDARPVGDLVPGDMADRISKNLSQLREEQPQFFGAESDPPKLDLRGGLGLYVYRSSASFRNVALEPID
jgi:serine/threonine-protein kinase